MAGGLMQLIAYGAQDIYLTGNPQITFFKVVYRRYTNFSVETIEHPFIGDPGFNKSLTAKITRNGDLVTKMYLRIVLDGIDPQGSKFAWVKRLGHAIVNQVEVDLGGTKIDRQYGLWLDVWYDLTRISSQDVGYAKMVGDVGQMTNYDDLVKPQYTLYVPLQFWFNRHTGLAIPLIALQYHDLNIITTFSDSNVLAIRDCNFDMSKLSMSEASILVDYVFLDTEERRRFAQVGHEYLIEQLQFNGTELVQSSPGLTTIDTTTTIRYKLDFNHPTKELIWAMNEGNYISGNSFIYYTNKIKWDLDDVANTIMQKSISIQNDPTNIVGGTWVPVLPGQISTVGTFNVNNSNASTIYINPTSLKIGDYGITDKIIADITVEADSTINVENIVTVLTVRDISIPLKYMDDTRFNTCDPIIYMFGNYGILIDGTVNPVFEGLLQLNGHDRFDKREGAWFNYVQPEMHHRNTPKDGINVYSFAIFPEEHQPSGSANLSRIDTTDLTLRFTDSTFENGLPPLYMFNPENRIWIFGTNYNILRIMSGMSGLAYSVA
jgi:hypothetical protein